MARSCLLFLALIFPGHLSKVDIIIREKATTPGSSERTAAGLLSDYKNKDLIYSEKNGWSKAVRVNDDVVYSFYNKVRMLCKKSSTGIEKIRFYNC